MKTVIIGGVAAGMSAATRLRRLDEAMEIVVVERGPDVSFANCGLPYHVGGVIPERSSLLVQSPEGLRSRFELDVRVRTEAISIDRAAKSVLLLDHEGAAYSESYDCLVLATGAEPRRLSLTGSIPVHGLHTIGDADALVAALSDGGEGIRAVVIGAGFIGLEAVENLICRGVRVTLVENADRILTALDPEMSAPIHQRLLDHGVDVVTGVGVSELDGDVVVLDDGTRIPADFIIEVVGVRPRTRLAIDAGLTIDPCGGILVDEQHRTCDPAIFAVGDVAAKVGIVDGARALIPLAGLANRHGRAVADVIAGRIVSARPALGTAIIGVFGATIAVTGWNEERLRAAGREYLAVHTHAASHAGYYPGAQAMALKLLVDPVADTILGAQAVGGDGVDKRIDVIAVAMSAGMRASELAELELCYAPQYGSAKDPVNILGYVASNGIDGITRSIQWHELDDQTILDVRTAAEYADGSIPGAVNIPLDELRGRLNELPDGPIVVHCHVGQRAHSATRILTQHGYEARNLDGGYRTWLDGMTSIRLAASAAVVGA